MRFKKILAGVLGAVILAGAGAYYNTYRTVTYISDNGDIYTGQYHWKSMWRSADDYGRFYRQYRHGYGREVSTNGWVWEGNWKNGSLHGEARKKKGSEIVIEGIFDDSNLVEGSKTYYGDGRSITKDGVWGGMGMRLLKGTYTILPEGWEIKSTFAQDSCNLPNGYNGSVTFTKDYGDIPAGTVWEARWENGWLTGNGIQTNPDGTSTTAEFHTDYFFKDLIIWKECQK